jgi:type II secretory pathway pseudopilin PulG
MGQQQLLLLVVTTVIVGLAIMIGVEVFGSSMAKANEDSVRKDIIEISSRLQQYYRTPEALGGGGYNFKSSLTFTNIGYYDDGVSGASFENANGTYTLSVSGGVVTITGAGNEAGVTLTYTLTANSTLKKLTLAEVSE